MKRVASQPAAYVEAYNARFAFHRVTEAQPVTTYRVDRRVKVAA